MYQWLRQHPGCVWSDEAKAWLVSEEIYKLAKKELSKNYNFREKDITPEMLPVAEAHTLLLPPQVPVSDAVSNSSGAAVFGEMGTGKTIIILDAFRRKAISCALVVCPASVRMSWQDILEQPLTDKRSGVQLRLWPDGPKALVVKSGKHAASLTQHDIKNRIVICSYGMVSKLVNLQFEGIALDEAHHVINYKTKTHRSVQVIAKQHPYAFKVLSTGTPVRRAAQNLHGMVDCLWPGRIGTYYRFTEMYCHVFSRSVRTGDGARNIRQVEGISLDPARAEALTTRLEAWTCRLTLDELQKYLPKLTTNTIRLAIESGGSIDDVQQVGKAKVPDVAQWCIDKLRFAENRHMIVCAHHKSVRDAYLEKFKKAGIATGQIAGGDSDNKRRQTIEELQAQDCSILVGSITAICEGLNVFSYIDDAIIGELVWQAPVMLQLIGRFRRLNRVKPCAVHFFSAVGTKEEAMCATLQWTLDQIKQTVGHGVSEATIDDLLETTRPSKEAMQRQLRESLGSIYDEGGWDELFDDD